MKHTDNIISALRNYVLCIRVVKCCEGGCSAGMECLYDEEYAIVKYLPK